MLRQHLMCQPSLAFWTYQWPIQNEDADPHDDMHFPHMCVDWDALHAWARDRSFKVEEGLTVRPDGESSRTACTGPAETETSCKVVSTEVLKLFRGDQLHNGAIPMVTVDLDRCHEPSPDPGGANPSLVKRDSCAGDQHNMLCLRRRKVVISQYLRALKNMVFSLIRFESHLLLMIGH